MARRKPTSTDPTAQSVVLAEFAAKALAAAEPEHPLPIEEILLIEAVAPSMGTAALPRPVVRDEDFPNFA